MKHQNQNNGCRERNITAIVSFFGDNESNPYVQYYHYRPFDDDGITKLTPILDEICPIINELILNGHNILIHCQKGVSRSASIALGYLLYIGVNFDNALNLVTLARPETDIKIGFIIQLKELVIISPLSTTKEITDFILRKTSLIREVGSPMPLLSGEAGLPAF